MKIYYINTTDKVSNATAKIMLGVADAVRNNGGESKVFSARYVDRFAHAVASRLTDREGEFSCVSTRKLLRDIIRYSPDVIHLSNIHGHYINYKMLFEGLNSSGIPVVWSIHDMWAVTGHCAVPIGCDLWKSGCKYCQHIDYYPKSWFVNRSGINFEKKRNVFTSCEFTIVTGSDYMDNLISQSFLSCHPRVVIPNSVDTTVFRSREAGQRSTCGNVKVIGVARNWEVGKNLDFFNKLKRAKPEWDIILVGNISSRLEHGITAMGYVSDPAELAEIYTSGDVFVNPSMFESFGMVVFEAMACGTPVVVNSATATARFINNTVGRSCDFSDVTTVIRMIEESVKLNRQDCSSFVSKNYSIEMTNNAYLHLYDSIITNVKTQKKPR